MTDLNIQMRSINGESWDNLYPKTKMNLVDGLPEALADQAAQLADIVINVKTLGADDTGVNNSEAAFRSAFAAIATAGGGTVKIPSGTYKLDLSETLQIPANCTIESSGVLNLISDDVIGFTASNVSNVHFYGGRINGSGIAGSAWAIFFDACTDSTIEGVVIRDGSSSGINFDSCTRCKILRCDIQQCYFYGIADKNGTGNIFSQNELSFNGFGSSTTGRGITVWMANGCEISYNRVRNNKEYGIRVYTQADDSSPTKKIRIIGNELVDNAVIYIYVYAELNPSYIIISENNIEQTEDSLTTGISVQGTGVKVTNNILVKSGTNNGSAFVLFNAKKCDIKDNKIFGYATVISASGTSKPSDCTIERNEAIDCKLFVQMFGERNIVRNNTAVHNGTPAVSGDYGYRQADNSVGCIVDGNKFVGFHSGIYIDYNVDFVLRNNVVRSSIHSNIRTNIFDFHAMEITGNDWDDFASSGQEILRSLEVRNGRYSFVTTDIPSTSHSSHVFAIGDYAIVRTPIAAGNAAWICTAAGTGGTWKTSGTIGS